MYHQNKLGVLYRVLLNSILSMIFFFFFLASSTILDLLYFYTRHIAMRSGIAFFAKDTCNSVSNFIFVEMPKNVYRNQINLSKNYKKLTSDSEWIVLMWQTVYEYSFMFLVSMAHWEKNMPLTIHRSFQLK